MYKSQEHNHKVYDTKNHVRLTSKSLYVYFGGGSHRPKLSTISATSPHSPRHRKTRRPSMSLKERSASIVFDMNALTRPDMPHDYRAGVRDTEIHSEGGTHRSQQASHEQIAIAHICNPTVAALVREDKV